MKYSLVALAATPVFNLVSAGRQTDSVPHGTSHHSGWGKAIVENDCSDAAYYMYDNHPEKKSIAAGDSLEVPLYIKDSNQGGMNIKLFKDKDTDVWASPGQPMVQFEITCTTQCFYDMSNVNSDIGGGLNGNGEKCDGKSPWYKEGMKIKTTGQEDDIACSPGESPCKAAYSKWNDDWATTSTPLSNDITLVLCLDQSKSDSKSEAQAQGQGQSEEHKKEEGQKGEQPKKEDPKEEQPPTEEPKEEKPEEPKKEEPKEEKKKEDSHDSSKDNSESGPVVQQKNEAENKDSKPDPSVVWERVTVTADPKVVVVTETAVANAKERRHNHVHQHVHNKINKRRHGA